MTVQNFTTVNRRIEEERRTKYCGTASLRITALQYRDLAHENVAGSKNSHVDAMKRMFRQENGCRKEDRRHHVKALVSQQVLEAAIASASIPSGSLMADTLPYPELEFPPDVKIPCLDGHDRLSAADEVLQGSKKRWVVDLYLDDLSDDLRLLLADGYDYQKKPDDGEFYVTIRQFQGYHGEENTFFENLWLARLATNVNSRRLFDQLSKNKKYSAAFDALLDMPGLFGGFRLSVIHQLLGMKCDEQNLAYLKHIYRWWHDVCDGNKAAMRQITRDTVMALQGMAPGACSTDRNMLLARLRSGGIFENFSAPQRQELWSRVCSASRRCLIPSLFTFFEDRKLLGDAASCIRNILDVGRKDTIAGCLEGIFSDANQRRDRCVIQLSETTFGSVAGDSNTRLDLGIRQLWLAAFRNYKDLPADTQRKDLLALSRTKADQTALYEFASLASQLGFESDKLDEILRKSTDRNIAESALLTARKPGRYEVRDPERCIQQILDAFAAAVPTSADGTADEAGDGIREVDQPPKRYGRPNNTDHDYVKVRLFLPRMHDEVDVEMGEMTSTFVQWSVYCAYFGVPPSIGDISTDENTAREDVVMAGNAFIECEQSEKSELSGNSSKLMTIGEEDITLAATRQELESEQANLRDASQKVRDMRSKLEQLAQDEVSQQERFNKINQLIQDQSARLEELRKDEVLQQETLGRIDEQIRDQNARLEKLRQDSALEQEKLDGLKVMVEQEQHKLDDGPRAVTQLLVEQQADITREREREREQLAHMAREPTVELATQPTPKEADAPIQPIPVTSKPRGAETQIVLHRTDRSTRLTFDEFLAHDPNREHQEAIVAAAEEVARGNGSESTPTVRIDFINLEPDETLVIADTVEVNPLDPSPVGRLALKYENKGYYLFDKEGNILSAENCFRKVVSNGSHTIVVRRPSRATDGRHEDSGRHKR